jgi:hypothetical protein
MTCQENNEAEGRDDKGRFVKGNEAGFSSRPEDINRKGRPPRPSLTAALLRRLTAEGNEHRDSGTRVADALVDATLKAALEGSFPHLKEVWSRLDGRGEAVLIPEGDAPRNEDEHKQAAVELYQAIIEDPLSTHRDRLVAQEGIVRLLGLVESSTTPEQAARDIQQAMNAMLDTTMQDPDDDETEGEDDKPVA